MSTADPHTSSLYERDRRHVWHPYDNPDSGLPIFAVSHASGVRITLEDGRELIDGMSSWWSAIHGYQHPALNQAAQDQLSKMSHVMFGGLTHEPAVSLCEKLVQLSPAGLERVFIADSGSVSVEVAVKMALQYWMGMERGEKCELIALRNAYHGDTIGAMGLCDPVNSMHHLFSHLLPGNHFLDAPKAAFDEQPSQQELDALEARIAELAPRCAALIIEPVVQGAGGMRFYSPAYLKHFRDICDRHELLLIFDEIATGFGRSGKLFAAEHAGVSPDILCLGKALTGGYLSLAATLCSNDIAKGIAASEAGAFMHGPTFMGNPLACAIANASIDTLLSNDWQASVQLIEQGLKEGLAPAAKLDAVAEVRCLGAIGVIELKQPVDMARIQTALVDRGVWVRPFGKLLYIMPPYVISDDDLATLCRAMVDTAAECNA